MEGGPRPYPEDVGCGTRPRSERQFVRTAGTGQHVCLFIMFGIQSEVHPPALLHNRAIALTPVRGDGPAAAEAAGEETSGGAGQR